MSRLEEIRTQLIEQPHEPLDWADALFVTEEALKLRAQAEGEGTRCSAPPA